MLYPLSYEGGDEQASGSDVVSRAPAAIGSDL